MRTPAKFFLAHTFLLGCAIFAFSCGPNIHHSRRTTATSAPAPVGPGADDEAAKENIVSQQGRSVWISFRDESGLLLTNTPDSAKDFPKGAKSARIWASKPGASLTEVKVFTCCGKELAVTPIITAGKGFWEVSPITIGNSRYRIVLTFSDGDEAVYTKAKAAPQT